MTTHRITIDRFHLESSKSFEAVLQALEPGIGRPNMADLQPKLNATSTFPEFRQLIESAVGTADLMEFLRLDLGGPLRKDPNAKAFKIVRIIAGNPLIMKQMVEHVPDAGSYAPVTILIYEHQSKVHLRYDTMTSLLLPYNNPQALKVAQDLDSKVVKLLTQAAG